LEKVVDKGTITNVAIEQYTKIIQNEYKKETCGVLVLTLLAESRISSWISSLSGTINRCVYRVSEKYIRNVQTVLLLRFGDFTIGLRVLLLLQLNIFLFFSPVQFWQPTQRV